jgi:hypothetical protein
MISEIFTFVNYILLGCDALYVERYVKRFRRNMPQDRRLQKRFEVERSRKRGT